jgi:hypothetical protein
MRRYTDPLALDPFSAGGITPIADVSTTTDPLALEPLSPLSAGARAERHPGRGTGHPTGDPPGRDGPRAPAASQP